MTQPLVSTLQSEFAIDVNTTPASTPTWTRVRGIMELTPPAPSPALQDDSDYDSGGWGSQTKTKLMHTTTLKVRRGVQAGTTAVYDPGQEFLRAAAMDLSSSRVVQFRVYSRTPGSPEAWSGYAEVGWSYDGGGMDAVKTATVTLSGVGALTTITNPS